MRGYPGNLGDSIVGEDELRSLCFDECRVLLGERVLGFGHDADEVRFGERLELDTNREASLKLGDEIARLRNVKRAGSHEQNVIGFDHPVLRLHVGSFDDREEIALDSLA